MEQEGRVILGLLSAVFVLAAAGYVWLRMMQIKDRLAGMAAMVGPMILGMLPSATLGVAVGVLLPHDLTPPTMLAVLFGLAAGFASGRPFGLAAVLEGMSAGVMGGMMGPMLGVMLGATAHLLLLFMDLVYLFMMLVLLQYLDSQADEGQSASGLLRLRFTGAVLLFAAGLCVIGYMLWN
ncbi:hypothetical protein [Paenibacillus sp. y28]|uniref:hypothetical protein n=1 Tax=Paenibacillus sp. y28 TaxID=3129110 RepID=UPI00301B1EE5